MKLQKVGEKVPLPDGEYEIAKVIIESGKYVFYGIDYKGDGDLWNVYAGTLEGEDVNPTYGIWDG